MSALTFFKPSEKHLFHDCLRIHPMTAAVPVIFKLFCANPLRSCTHKNSHSEPCSLCTSFMSLDISAMSYLNFTFPPM